VPQSKIYLTAITQNEINIPSLQYYLCIMRENFVEKKQCTEHFHKYTL